MCFQKDEVCRDDILVNQQTPLQGKKCYILEQTSPFSGPKI